MPGHPPPFGSNSRPPEKDCCQLLGGFPGWGDVEGSYWSMHNCWLTFNLIQERKSQVFHAEVSGINNGAFNSLESVGSWSFGRYWLFVRATWNWAIQPFNLYLIRSFVPLFQSRSILALSPVYTGNLYLKTKDWRLGSMDDIKTFFVLSRLLGQFSVCYNFYLPHKN